MTLFCEHDITEAEYRRLSRLIHERCGINLHDGKRELVRARLAKHLRQGNFASLDEYLDTVEDDATGQRLVTLIDSLSTNLTSFFRERDHFHYLVSDFLPALRRRKEKEPHPRLRAWSAGCSSGEEPYSLAITLLDEFAGFPQWDIKLLATDISTRVLATAEAGEYRAERLADVSPQQKAQHFLRLRDPRARDAAGRDARARGARPSDARASDARWRDPNAPDLYRVADATRSVVRFRRLNLMEAWPFTGPFDFIFCRNVMIYFDKPTQERLVNRFHECLDRGGLLFTGHSESLTGINHRFRYVRPTVYLKA